MTTFASPVVATYGATDPAAPLVVLLHGRGSNEEEILSLAPQLPDGATYAAVRAPISEGGGYAWFANRGIGRPVADRRLSSDRGRPLAGRPGGQAASTGTSSAAVRTPAHRRTSAGRSSRSMGAAFSYSPHCARGSIHITSNSLPSGSLP